MNRNLLSQVRSLTENCKLCHVSSQSQWDLTHNVLLKTELALKKLFPGIGGEASFLLSPSLSQRGSWQATGRMAIKSEEEL